MRYALLESSLEVRLEVLDYGTLVDQSLRFEEHITNGRIGTFLRYSIIFANASTIWKRVQNISISFTILFCSCEKSNHCNVKINHKEVLQHNCASK